LIVQPLPPIITIQQRIMTLCTASANSVSAAANPNPEHPPVPPQKSSLFGAHSRPEEIDKLLLINNLTDDVEKVSVIEMVNRDARKPPVFGAKPALFD
jgi:hypothetical protein